MLYSYDFDETLMAPLLTEDDAFNSQPTLGNIAYRLPALHDLLGVPEEFLASYSYLGFRLSVLPNMDHGTHELECDRSENCGIGFHRTYTPRMHYISSPVIYHDSWT
jgi:hypothetical protein